MKKALQEGFQRKRRAFEELYVDSKGKPFSFDSDDMRTLHFDDRYIQSAMRISAPDELLLSYTRAMMAFLLFQREPASILIIGLGGGSLPKYCHRILPRAKITVLELDADVIALRDKFAVPAESERFQVVHTDAKDYVETTDQRVDVILHDGFDADGLAPSLSTESFYAACRKTLSDDGVLVSNLWGDAGNLSLVMDRLWTVFDAKLWWSSVSTSLNRVVWAVNGNGLSVPALHTQAVRLDLIYDLSFVALVERIQTAQGKSRAEFKAISDMSVFAEFMHVASDEDRGS
ncbi:fused MFS/spermidine synthase [Herbaspirillum sp. RV1423]|uniref:fused MFS/spermidine synthase n=1 Tax=Herbaspirillum sp. RV1423 TaxID=1443993 RepID=UPI0004B5F03C|nr:fused MFS/spermidine synthase [Herbaspirillum sp. RV1423]